MPRRFSAAAFFIWLTDWRLAGILAGSFVSPHFVAFAVTSRETGSINFAKVTESRFLEIVRAFRAKALRFLTIVLSGLEASFVRLLSSFFAVLKDVRGLRGDFYLTPLAGADPWVEIRTHLVSMI